MNERTGFAEGDHPRTRGGRFTTTRRAEADVELFFHVAPDDARDSITEHGLDHSLGDSAYADTSLDYPQGNYLFADPDAAAAYAELRAEEEREEYGAFQAREYDVYEVRPEVPLHLDPFRNDESGLGTSAVYTEQPIPADQVRLIG